MKTYFLPLLSLFTCSSCNAFLAHEAELIPIAKEIVCEEIDEIAETEKDGI